MSSIEPSGTVIHDFIGIGLGPFNLGLAALTAPIEDLDGIFLERKPNVDWHPGMLIEGTTMQVPFMADLVTLADPTSAYSFLNYLKESGRIYPFYIRESFFQLRTEFQDYLRWAAEKLDNLRFERNVVSVAWEDGVYAVRSEGPGGAATDYARRLVLGTGTPPWIPPACRELESPTVCHASAYLEHRERLRECGSITVVGSGQSAAEIYRDLLGDIEEGGYELNWVTRSPRFFPLEYTKLTLEMTSPEYVDYFHGLPSAKRDELNAEHKNLYKGINAELINEIFDLLYQKRFERGSVPTRLFTNCTVEKAAGCGSVRLSVRQHEQDRSFELQTEGLVLATGYSYRVPDFMDEVRDRLRFDATGRLEARRDYSVDAAGEGEVFVQNAELATHGFVSPDLGMAAYRNSWIIRSLTGREVYPIERRIGFQEFGAPE
ncbi:MULTISPECIES: lysine N(6)-hydroxylase/L-ornithine N(5)-oxygenase family protein [Glycomyces]|uniref:L-lysine N6-monooxygenase MbtG n=2 Tax=Glycomyces TaxID=58113 RepID=A0A9X3PII0_9ACTN|nr:lysine N(6)-hydroxylase/L-ornithine N(5)-oxygenase family protein [Glycomyces lechevalierae]MDA1385885.1 lysine N(6)-hydroxylase/L-ornithine N(5)-oxygenase family protein [Glycomyces lechevalierae]MDR7340006.1 lysine N6-hydroxylase [Glycomyces lechevalierae]